MTSNQAVEPRRRGIFAVVVAVHDLDKALDAYRRLGFGLRHRASRLEWGVEAAMLEVENCIFEVIQPVDTSKKVGKNFQRFLDERGQGIYLISLDVDDIDAEYELLRDAGIEVPGPPTVAPPDGEVDARLLWPSPRSTESAFLEFVQLGENYSGTPRNIDPEQA